MVAEVKAIQSYETFDTLIDSAKDRTSPKTRGLIIWIGEDGLVHWECNSRQDSTLWMIEYMKTKLFHGNEDRG
jgi:hypothetical protein